MPVETIGLAETLRHAALTAFGLIMAATPLALWVAWSKTTFILVLAIGAAAGVLFCVLYGHEKSSDEEQREDSSPGTMENLDDEFFLELSSLGPFVYHNRRPEDPTFRRKMDGLLGMRLETSDGQRRTKTLADN